MSCGDIITGSDGDDSGLWCLPIKTTAKSSGSHEALAKRHGISYQCACLLLLLLFLSTGYNIIITVH